MSNSHLWAEYARLQSLANSRVISDQTWALDEALDVVLAMIEKRQPISAQQIDNLVSNRATKHRHRRHSLLQYLSDFTEPSCDDHDRYDAQRELDRHKDKCTSREWSVLAMIGLGHTYGEIGATENVPEATVKTWVRRARDTLSA